MVDFYDFLWGLLSGIFIGYFLEYVRFKYSLKIEKIRRLSPFLESIFPIFEKIASYSVHAKNIRNWNDENELNRTVDVLRSEIDEWHALYLQFQQDGLKPELEAVNSELYAELNGMFVIAQMSRRYGESYILQNIEEIATKSENCKKLLASQLKK
jgi:hypothetical protein